MIQTFIGFSTIGRKFCELILLYCKISFILQKPYSELRDSSYSSVKLFELLVTSNQSDCVSQSTLTDSIGSQSSEAAADDKVDGDRPAQSIDRYMEAILCDKDLIQTVAGVDEGLNSEDKNTNLPEQDGV